MELDAILCNHAEAVNNLLYLSGGGIGATYAPAGAPPPYAVHVGIGMLVTVPWGQTNQQHTIKVQLVGEDGQEVQLPAPDGSTEGLSFELAFNVGRPADLPVGNEQLVALATNLAGLPLPALGKYEFVISIDGNPERRLGLRVAAQPGGQITFGQGQR